MVNVRQITVPGNIESAEVGALLASLSVGPVSLEDALSVAWLTMEYNPSHLFSKTEDQSARTAPMLHPVWFSGLVDAAIGSISARSRIASLTVNYHGQASIGDTLLVEITLLARDRESGSVRIGFQVCNQRGTNLAGGDAEMKVGT